MGYGGGLCAKCGLLPYVGGEIGRICVECHSDLVYAECIQHEKTEWPPQYPEEVIKNLRSFACSHEERRGIEKFFCGLYLVEGK